MGAADGWTAMHVHLQQMQQFYQQWVPKIGFLRLKHGMILAAPPEEKSC
jgi:hypothetical protein